MNRISTVYCYNHSVLEPVRVIKFGYSIKNAGAVVLTGKLDCGCSTSFVASKKQYEDWLKRENLSTSRRR